MEGNGVVMVQDFTSSFTTDRLFANRDELLTWVRNIGKAIGIAIVISRSDTGKRSGKEFCTLICDKGGVYKTSTQEGTTTRKCSCQFRLKGKFIKKRGGWILKVMCGTHNHPVASYGEGHPYNGRLTGEEKVVVDSMTKNHIAPQLILNELITQRPHDSKTTLKQIYNCRARQRSAMRGGRTELQQLMKLLERDKYVYWSRVADGTNVVKDIFWAHPDSIDLVNTFPIVLLIDSTYKTNRYKYPLVEIVGVTSTEKTFSVAFAYVNYDRFDHFAWVCEKLRGLFRDQDELPQVIVTDNEEGLMNAISAVFPSSKNLLCQFHIKKNVRAHARKIIKDTPIVEDVMNAFLRVVHAKTFDEYDFELGLFYAMCAPYPTFIEYANNQWLIPYKEMFVDAWINKYMHLGNTTTNRVESAHSRLKKILGDSRGDLCKSWDSICTMLRIQFNELKMSFEQSISRVKISHRKKIYEQLRGLVSSNAIDHIGDELQRSGAVSINPRLCGCVIKTTHGLPCACELNRCLMDCSPIPLDLIHKHWLYFKVTGEDNFDESELNLSMEIEAIQRRFAASDYAGKVMLKAKARELAFPDTTSMCPPPEPVITKGAPKKAKKVSHAFSTKRDPSFWEHVDDKFESQEDSCTFAQSRKRPTPSHSKNSTGTPRNLSQTKKRQLTTPPTPTSTPTAPPAPIPNLILTPAPTPKPYVPPTHAVGHTADYYEFINHMPQMIHPYVENIVNVGGDGHCGFRCIAALLGKGEDEWLSVRNDLLDELKKDCDFYVELFGGMSKFTFLMKLLIQQNTGEDNWMTVPDIGYLIVNTYKVMLTCWHVNGSFTIYPFHIAPFRNIRQFNICCTNTANNKGQHFVQVFMKPASPLPLSDHLWTLHKKPVAKGWETVFMARTQEWKAMVFLNKPPTYVDTTND